MKFDYVKFYKSLCILHKDLNIALSEMENDNDFSLLEEGHDKLGECIMDLFYRNKPELQELDREFNPWKHSLEVVDWYSSHVEEE